MFGLSVELVLMGLAIIGGSSLVVAVIAALRPKSKRLLSVDAVGADRGRPHDYTWIPSQKSYSFARFETVWSTRAPGGLDAQTDDWRTTMTRLGAHLSRHRVGRIVLVHGTFTGNDPFALVQQLNKLLTQMHPRLGQALLTLTKQQLDRLMKDSGNFSPAYAQLTKTALGGRIPCDLFIWSSANHHVARLRAARDLILDLAASSKTLPADRILLIGHSHAGQVFALATHLLARSKIGISLFDILARDDSLQDSAALETAVETLRTRRLDFVTLGAPPRYGYCEHPKFRRLLHLVNHRGEHPRGGSVAGTFHTKDGDYIQQWGIAGSDLVAQTAEDRAFNAQLDSYLNVGADPALWLENANLRPRVPRDGHTLLVDYDDASMLKPNFYATGLGHAIYTKQQMLRFNFELIADHLYGWTRGR